MVRVAALTLAVAAIGEGTAFADAPAPTTTVDAKAIPKAPKPAPPKVEAPEADQPKVEPPKPTPPKAEKVNPAQPKAEKPKAAQPKVEQPKVEKAKAEKPKPATTKAEKPKVGAPSATPNELGSQRGAAATTVSPPQATPSAGAASATRGAGTRRPAAEHGRKVSRPLGAAGAVTPQRSRAGAAMSGHDAGSATTPPAAPLHAPKRVPTSPPHVTSHGVAAAARSPGRRLLPVPRLEAKPRSDATLVLAIVFGAGVGLLFGRRVRRPLGPG